MDDPFIAMECWQGQTLRHDQCKAVEIETVLDLGIQIADASTRTFEGHRPRDIKPANLLVHE